MALDSKVFGQLRGVAAKLTSNFELQKDLIQEMAIHLVRVNEELPGHTPSWYIKSCEFQARNYLKLGRSVDSLKRSSGLVSLNAGVDQGADYLGLLPLVDHSASEIATRDVLNSLQQRLTVRQREVLTLLLRGYGMREIGRRLGISHVAVIKLRKKIAIAARELIAEPPVNALFATGEDFSRLVMAGVTC